MTDDMNQGDRIAKVLARAGVASRREAERLISIGAVAVNGRVIDSPALNIGPKDRVTVNGRPVAAAEPPRLWLYYKPVGLVTSERDEKGRETVFESLPEDLPRVISVGRLDLNSEGLLLLTNDGEIKRRLELPSTGWLRKYRVRVNGRPEDSVLEPLRQGIEVEGERFQPMQVVLDRQQGANAWLSVGLREGKNREIRRAMDAIGLAVNRLIRTGYGPFRLDDMEPGEVREVKARVLKDQLGLREEEMGTMVAHATPKAKMPRRVARTGAPDLTEAADPSASLRRPVEKKGFKSAGFKSHGGKPGEDRPARAAGTRSHKAEDRSEGDTARAPRSLSRDRGEDRPAFAARRGEDKPRSFGKPPREAGAGDRPRRPYSDGPRRGSDDRPPREDFARGPRDRSASDASRGPRPDRAAGNRPARDKSAGERPARGPREERAFGDRKPRSAPRDGESRPPRNASGDRTERGDRPARSFNGDRPQGGSRSGPGDRPKRAFGEGGTRPYGEGRSRPAEGDAPRGPRKPYGDKPGGGKSFGDRSGGKPSGDRSGGKPFGDRSGGKPSGDRSGGKPFGDRSGGKSFGGKPGGGKSFGGKPGGAPRTGGSGPRDSKGPGGPARRGPPKGKGPRD